MNTTLRLHPIRQLVLPVLTGLLALSASLHAQTSTVTVNASSVIRNVPPGLRGVCAGGTFWKSTLPDYREDMIKARIGLVRIGAFPNDSTSSGVASASDLDTKVAQILNAGAVPLFIQAINDSGRTYSDAKDDTVRSQYLDLNGNLYPEGSTVPTSQRIATNLTYLVNRYKAPPFNLTTQYWEVGNEPDEEDVNYRVQDTAEYNADFQAVHTQLTTSGLRGNVLLAGPAVARDYAFNGVSNAILSDFLTACGSQVNIVTRHVYAAIENWSPETSMPVSSYSLLNNSMETLHFNPAASTTKGEGGLLALMSSKSVPASVGTGFTEMNLGYNRTAPHFFYTPTQGLWFLLANHYSLYNTRCQLTAGFQFDRYNVTSSALNVVAFYDANKLRSYPYWASYIQNALTGDQVLAQTSSDSHVVVTATKDASYLYVRLMNRHDTTQYVANVAVSNAPPVSAPTLYTLSSSETPDTGTPLNYTTTFSHPLPPLTVCVLRFPRTDAPQPPQELPPPSTVHLDTGFDTPPSGMLVYSVGYTPVVASSHLQLTNTVANSRAAVVFNGQPLPSATSRVQARFGFKVMHPYAEGFVFGAYSANPGAVGNAGGALGYEGQANRIWGVKIDNNPDEIGVVSSMANSTVDGWVSRTIPQYSGTDMYAVVDYDGSKGTVRARLYQGTSDTGTLWADITNKVGNPSTLPAGTVFGFAGACGTSYSQTTYIENLRVLVDDSFVIGQEIILDSSDTTGVVRSAGWTLSSAIPGAYNGSYYHDGNAGKGSRTVTYTPTFPSAGWREVWARWTVANTLRASNTPYTVSYSAGSTTIPLDQRVDGSNWIKLGTWYFNAGSSGNVVVGNAGTNNNVIADAVRFINVNP